MTDALTIHGRQFPRSHKYNPDWVLSSVSGGANSLWLTEWLSSSMTLTHGMKVLDLGCGRAASSIFLNREYGVDVWATDLWFDPAENQQRINDAGAAKHIVPIRSDARALPFETDFFDVIVSIDSYFYYGTDDLYLNYLARFLKPGGVLAIAQTGIMREFDETPPPHLKALWDTERSLWCLHSAQWWRSHWLKTGIVEIELADTMPNGWQLWNDWIEHIAPDNRLELNALQSDHGDNLGYVRVIARKRHDVQLDMPTWQLSIPSSYQKRRLLRETPLQNESA